MARTIPIVSITPSNSTSPGQIRVSGTFSSLLQGKFYSDGAGNVETYRSSPTMVPAGFSLIQATAFDIIDNPSYNGHYTVFTATDALESSANDNGDTNVYVNEVIGTPLSVADATAGSITNITTFLLNVIGGSDILILPGTIDDSTSIELAGYASSNWGEGLAQNQLLLAQNFAGPMAPTNPIEGQSWFNTTTGQMLTYSFGSFGVTNAEVFGVTYRHTQSSAASTWNVNHNLNLSAPFIALVQVFKDVGSGVPKMIFPSDITFVGANNLTVTFTDNTSGWVLVKL